MQKINSDLDLAFKIAKIQAAISHKFDTRLGGGLGFNYFWLLYLLSQAEEGKLRRIDLAEKVGLTASGITRMLAPMEKIGLIKREQHPQDARVSFVSLAPGGKRLLEERIEKAEMLLEEILPQNSEAKVKEAAGLLAALFKGVL